MEYLKILSEIIGHIAWPIAIFGIAILFKKEVGSLLKRVKKAKYKGMELDLENEFKEVKAEAADAGVTIMYPSSSFQPEVFSEMQLAPELVFIRTWQEIESILNNAFKERYPVDKRFPPVSKIVSTLVEDNLINNDLASLIRNMYSLRNKIVHSSDFNMTRGELIEWQGLSKSIIDRLTNQLRNSKI